MSSKSIETITCPKCKEEHSFTMWRSINTVLNPEMRAAVKDRSAFQFVCPTCGEKRYVDYGFLYHQMEDEIMIHYVCSDEEEKEIYDLVTGKKADNMFQDLLDANYLIRIVRSQNELREKISIFDEGLDDRIIEIIKLFVLASYQDQNPGDDATVSYYVKEGEEDRIEIYGENQYKGYFMIPKDLYEDIFREYSGRISDIRKSDPIVNRQWAIEILDPEKKKEALSES